MNKSNWTEEDHIEYAEMKRDEALDERKERDREFEEYINSIHEERWEKERRW